MKNLIATALITLASSSAFAFDASWDANEFYDGIPGQTAGVASIRHDRGFDDNLYLEGNFPKAGNGHGSVNHICNTDLPEDLYSEGNFAV